MKKTLLLSIGLIPAFAMAQNKSLPQVDPALNVPEKVKSQEVLTEFSPLSGVSSNPKYFAKRSQNYGVNFIEVGNTFYDLQSNGSSGRRVLLHSDGSVSVVWTTAPDATAGFPLRGSGYNHINGTNVSVGLPNTGRIENARTGWPSIAVLPNGNEVIIGHDATAGGFKVTKNTSKGSSTWTTSASNVLTYPDGQRPIWNRMAANGNTLHLISNFSDSSAPGDPRVLSLNGVRGPMTYSRSLDGGTTWDKDNIVLPGYDSTRILSGGGDNYAIDVRGNTVAIVVGGLGKDVLMFKSTDNGETFTRIIVDNFPYSPFNGNQEALDTPATNDGTLDVLIDNNDNAHVFWGFARVFDNDPTDNSFSFFPATAALAYWNEITTTRALIAGVVDENENQTLDIQPGTWAGLQNGQIPSNVISVARTGNTSLVNMPSAGIDAQGRIFVTYSAPREGDVSIDDVNFRDVYLVFSSDNGATWSEPQNLTQAQSKEDAFPVISKRVDDFVHLLWQQDEIPGTNLQNNSESAGNHPIQNNTMLYAAIPVTKIVNEEIGQGPGVGIQELSGVQDIFKVTQNYPNPFANETNVTIYLGNTSELMLSVTNLLGQEVIRQSLGEFTAGNHQITLDASKLSAGMYQYTISTKDNSISHKMMVK